MTESGKYVIKLCITQRGDVAYASIVESESKSKAVMKKILEAAIGYKYSADNNAPCVECGKLTVRISLNDKY